MSQVAVAAGGKKYGQSPHRRCLRNKALRVCKTTGKEDQQYHKLRSRHAAQQIVVVIHLQDQEARVEEAMHTKGGKHKDSRV
mmetsp:Transcript_42309/g.66267  ORF Transcript_42309/g.66267 Transcript_42309/m.66267 type:complete len:82 (-) Transcript_42309:254-499(-)